MGLGKRGLELCLQGDNIQGHGEASKIGGVQGLLGVIKFFLCSI